MKIASAALTPPHTRQLSSVSTVKENTVKENQDNNTLNQLKSTLPAQAMSLSGTDRGNQDSTADSVTFSRSEKAGGLALVHVYLEGDKNLDRIKAVFEGLDEDQQQRLVDTGIFNKESFLDVAEQLSEEELGKLLNTIDALQTPPQLRGVRTDSGASAQTAIDFIDAIAGMDEQSRSRVLDKADALASKVAPYAEPDTYQPEMGPARYKGSTSANDLHNFAFAIAGTEDANQMLDSLESFDEQQQSHLLTALGANVDQGTQLMDNLADRSKASQDSVLKFMSGLMEESRKVYDAYDAHKGTQGVVWTSIDFDNVSSAPELIDNTLALLENYTFSDEQLLQMTDQLNAMDRSDQRAYLTITTTGLDHLLGGTAENPVSLNEHKDALETIDGLRNSDTVRDLVFKSRLGGETGTGEHLYELQDASSAQRDQQQMVQFLATDAWLHPEDASRATTLASKLDQLGTDQRDTFTRMLETDSSSQGPLTQQSETELQQYESFLNRTNSLVSADDASALFAAEASVNPELREGFWQATALAGDNVDELADTLLENSPDIRQQIIETLAMDASQVTGGEQNLEDAHNGLKELLDYFGETHTVDQKQQYLARL